MLISVSCFGEKINLVIPFSPGGNIDNIAQLIIETANKQNNTIIPVYKTGGDGIGGVSVLASETFESKGPAKRPAVQVGDPFVEKVLIECSLEIFAEDLVVGIQDLGGAGLSCATSELASGGSGGMKVQLDKVPLRDPSLSPEEILMSESQERMCAIVEPSKIARFLEICEKWDVTVTVIGEVTDGNHLEITWNGELIVDVPPRTVAHDGPVYQRPFAQPAYIDHVAQEVIDVPLAQGVDEIRATVLQLAAAPNLADKSWITSQYDKYVQGNTIQSQPDDSGMVRIDEETHLGVAISTDANANWSYLNPYEGAKLALLESCRNLATTGAKPLAVTNCLNFGSPEDPGVMWQFAETVRGLADATLELGLPVTGGNVSFYNQTQDVAILPTPVIGVLGVVDDVRKRTPMGFTKSDLDLYLIGEADANLSGSEWAHLHGEMGDQAPKADLDKEFKLVKFHQAKSKAIEEILDNSIDEYYRGHVTEIHTTLSPDKKTVTIADNGIGLPAEMQSGGFGLVSMRERANALGAKFSMANGRLSGVVIRVEFDLDSPIFSGVNA